MRRWRLALVLPAAAIAVLVGAVPAQAKGPTQATISGPGLAKSIVVDGMGEPGASDRLAELADGSGLFRFLFGSESGQGTALAQQPAGALGPKFALSYQVPAGELLTIRQDLYPFAAGGPVTYTPPGQRGFTDQPTGSGWYRAPGSFSALLTALCVTAPSPSPASVKVAAAHRTSSPHRSFAGPIALAGALVAVLLAGGVLLRRRGGSTTGS